MYIPQPVKIKLKDGVVETAGGIRKITVVFMELLDVEIAVSDDKDTLEQVWLQVAWWLLREACRSMCHYGRFHLCHCGFECQKYVATA